MALGSARRSLLVAFQSVQSRLRISAAGVDTATESAPAVEQKGCAECWGAKFAIDVLRARRAPASRATRCTLQSEMRESLRTVEEQWLVSARDQFWNAGARSSPDELQNALAALG